MNDLPNENLYITRKRKKWKFAHFNSYPNCFELKRGEDAGQIQNNLKEYFKNKQPIVLELAAGNAQFSLQLAQKHPEQNFIAIDIKSDRLYTSAKRALNEGVANIAFVRTHMNELNGVFKKNSVDEIWLTFPDPFPRTRSEKHRLTHDNFLRQYREILKPNGLFKFKTDNRDLFLWSLEQFVAHKWNFVELSFDLHESNLPEDYKIMTHYEQKFTAQGVPINHVTLSL